jgi:hypothetical protein
MGSFFNDRGAKNGFGYYDSSAQDIVLRRPCFKKSDIEEVYAWLDSAKDLARFSIGLGAVENFLASPSSDNGLYDKAKATIKQQIFPMAKAETDILKNMLDRLNAQDSLQMLNLRCYIFNDAPEAFASLLAVIRRHATLSFLDLTGCYFSDEQLIELSEVIAKSMISRLNWPEARLSPKVLEKVLEIFKNNASVTNLRGAPMEMSDLILEHREKFLWYGRHSGMITDEDKAFLIKYTNSVRTAIATEKQILNHIEKALEGAIA